MNSSRPVRPLPRRNSIRARIALLVAGVAAMAVAIFTLATWHQVREAALVLAGERMVASARPIAASISAAGVSIQERTRVTAELPEVRAFLAEPSDANGRAALEAFRQIDLPGNPVLEIRSTAGARLLASAALLPPPGTPLGSPEVEALDAWVSPLSPGVVPSAADDRQSVFYGGVARVGTAEAPLGTVIHWRMLETTPEALQLVRGLIDPTAQVYLADLDAGVWTDFAAGVPALELGDSPIEGLPVRAVRASGADPGNAYLALVPAPPTPWVVGVRLPRGVIQQGSDRLVRWLILAGLLLVLASACIGWFLAGRITRGLDALAAAADELRRGNDETRVTLARTDEIGMLAGAFNAMAERVSDSRRSLEAKVREVSEREAEAREVRERLEHLVSSSRAILFRYALSPGNGGQAPTDSPGPSTPNVRWISDNLQWILALDPTDALAPLWWDNRIHPDDLASVRTRAALLGQEESVVMEYRFRHGDGSYRWLRDERRVRSDARDDGPGSEEVEVVGVLSDITRSHQLELAHAAAEGANRAKTEFLSRMSHELRTPLTAVLGFGQLIRDETGDETAQEHAAQVVRAGEHLLALIEEVLDITGIEAGRIRVSTTGFDVAGVIAEAADLVRFAADERGVTLVVRPHENGTTLYAEADRRRLRQVLVNLLTNGIKYNRPGGRVEIGAEPAGPGRLQIVVEDTGRGIAEEMQARLFVPFDRLGMEELEPEGTGLGLPLSRALVEAMRGTLRVSSLVGTGSEFRVELPEAKAGAGEAGGKGPTQPVAGEVGAGGAPGRTAAEEVSGTVLVVEDHPANLTLFRRIFRRRPGVELLTAAVGAEGIRMAVRHRPDLVLLDLNLPDMGGEEVLAEIRNHAELQHTTVIMISGDASPAQARRLLGLGAFAYLFKPFVVAELLAMVDERLALGSDHEREGARQSAE
ncbi:MAG: response regulator [Gemmatimonadales bacterium]|nr:MAG: response regulator [Gemmatimonadales bacterium]